MKIDQLIVLLGFVNLTFSLSKTVFCSSRPLGLSPATLGILPTRTPQNCGILPSPSQSPRPQPPQPQPNHQTHHRGTFLHTIYLENLPDNCHAAFVCKITSKFPSVLDVYVPKKLNKKGRRFAFVRVDSFSTIQNLLNILNIICIGVNKLRAFRSRFEKAKRNMDSMLQKRLQRHNKVMPPRQAHPTLSIAL